MKHISTFLLLLTLFLIPVYSQKTRTEDLAKKIQDATPKALPQSPIVKKIKSDAEDDGFKGKVKSVSETEEDLSGTWFTKGIKMSSETFYDEKGNRVKYIDYDYQGNPSGIIVYGYLDRMRVSKSGYIDYPYNPPPMMMPSNEKEVPTKSADSRYSVKYENKYDDKKRLKESVSYRNNGEMINKIVYSYDGNKMEMSAFDEDGKLYSRTIDLIDDKSNIIEHTFVYLDGGKPDSITVYTYNSFDEKGNWTKRAIKYKDVENNSNKQSNYVEYRKITYYP